jgi:hypothetical protein
MMFFLATGERFRRFQDVKSFFERVDLFFEIIAYSFFIEGVSKVGKLVGMFDRESLAI